MGRVGWVAICWEDADPRYLHETGEGSVSRQNKMLALCSFSLAVLSSLPDPHSLWCLIVTCHIVL